MRYKFFIILILMPLILYAVDIYHKTGTTGAQFLKIGIGARSEAIAGAFTSITGDNYNMYYNPAGLIDIENKSFTAHHNKWLDDLKYEFLGYSFKLNRFDAIGISVMYLHMGDIVKTDDNGNNIGFFTAEDMALNISYAYNFNEDFYLGCSGKYIKQNNAGYKADGFAVDFGLIGNHFKESGFTYGFSVLNIGPKIKFINEADKLPLTWRAGTNYNYRNRLIISFDLVKPIDNNISQRLGTEFNINNFLFLRMGYNSDDDLDNGFTYGCGFKFNKLNVDYAFVPQNYFGDSHRFSISYNW